MGILDKFFGSSNDPADPAQPGPGDQPKSAKPKAAAKAEEAEAEERELDEDVLDLLEMRRMRMDEAKRLRIFIEQMVSAFEAVARIDGAMQPLVSLIQGLTKSFSKAETERRQQMLDLRAHFTSEIDRLSSEMKDRLVQEAGIDVWKALLPALDDIDHVLREAKTKGDMRGLDSLRLIRRKLRDSLSRLGIEEIWVDEGVTLFDPRHHEGRPYEGDEESKRALPAGTVVSVERIGYSAGEKVLRCALTTVIKG